MKLAVCGCSFSATVEGEYANTHWSELLANTMDYELINFARQGISNAAIRVQLDEAIAQHADYVCIGFTTEDRIELPLGKFQKVKDGSPNHTAYMDKRNGWRHERGLQNFNYGNRHPYTMISETIFSIIDKLPHNYRVAEVPENIRLAVEGYAAFMYDAHWKKQLDRWVINSGLWKLHDLSIPFLYNPWTNVTPVDMNFDMPEWFQKRYFVSGDMGFGVMCDRYPHTPDIGYHTSPQGQKAIANGYWNFIQNQRNNNENFNS